MIAYNKIKLTNDSNDATLLDQLVTLSKEWEQEKSCPSYDANDSDYFLNKDIYIGVVDDTVIAYALGETKTLKEKTSYNTIGETSFELDEMYVSKGHRRQNIGKELFQFLETSLKGSVDLIGVIATSYRYNELLNFYINELDMDFKYALLVKRM